MHKTILISMLALAIALLAAGCGGGDDTETASTASLSKAEFVKQANAMCKQLNKKRTADYEARIKKNPLSTEEIITEITLPSIQKVAEGLDELAAPKGNKLKVEAFVADIEDGVKKAEEGDPEAFEAPLALVENRIEAYGLISCSAAM